MRKPYSVLCPTYEVTSGGIRVMWALRSWLDTKGEIVLDNVTFDGPFVAVYPEIVNGNPLRGQDIVRYILQKPGMMTTNGVPGPTVFDPKDKIFVFSELYNSMGVDKDHIMFLPVLNLKVFKDQHKQRKGSCVFVGKGNPNLVKPGDYVLDRVFAQDQEKLADYLNSIEVMYGYDPVSAMYDIARLCGCRVVILTSNYTKEEFAKYELCQNFNGISWGRDEGRKVDVPSFRTLYINMIKLFDKKIDFFIDETQK